jgi:hypothetical protein
LQSKPNIKLKASGFNLQALCDNLEAGADGLILLAHGAESTGIQVGNESLGGIKAADLLEPFKVSASKGHPLRFLLVFACEQRRAFLDLLGQLADQGALHVDFAAVLFWGRPKTAFGESFLPCLLHELTREDTPKPFLEAMRLARQAFLEEPGNTLDTINCVYPIAVAFHPQPNPLPTAQELELERYWWQLSRLHETEFGR